MLRSEAFGYLTSIYFAVTVSLCSYASDQCCVVLHNGCFFLLGKTQQKSVRQLHYFTDVTPRELIFILTYVYNLCLMSFSLQQVASK